MKSEEFMLKEYEQLYELYKIHYEYSDKLINHFLLVVGGFLTIASFVYKDRYGQIDMFNLEPLVLSALYISTIACFSFYLMLIEHRLKILLYARSVNGIRKWAISNNLQIKPYLVLPDNVNIPQYFTWFSGFFWELFAFGLLNSIIMGLSLVHLIRQMVTIRSANCTPLFIGIVTLLTGIHLLIYKMRGRRDVIIKQDKVETSSEEEKSEPPLTPGNQGRDCVYNGNHKGIECRCDECDYYLECFPDWKLRSKKIRI